MSFTFRPAVRESASVIIGLAGSTGSGKTYSALRLATGLAGGEKFAVIDTENGRALHYADAFTFDHARLDAPFRPAAYAEAIQTADQAGYPVIVVDSFSHEHAGEGGLLDWHDEELDRMAGDDWKKRDAVTFAAWSKPKREHKAMVQKLLQTKAPLILCLRAEEKIEIVKDPQTGKVRVQPKRSLTGLDGWVPIAEKSLAYEFTASVLLTPDAPGVPKPIKLQEQHRAFFPLDQPVSEESGKALGAWARGGTKSSPAQSSAMGGALAGIPTGTGGASTSEKTDPGSGASNAGRLAAGASIEWAEEPNVTQTLELAARVSPEEHDKLVDKLAKQRDKYENRVRRDWLRNEYKRLAKLAPADEPEQPRFAIPESAR